MKTYQLHRRTYISKYVTCSTITGKFGIEAYNALNKSYSPLNLKQEFPDSKSCQNYIDILNEEHLPCLSLREPCGKEDIKQFLIVLLLK